VGCSEKRTLENSDGRGEVIDTPGSAESGSDDRGGGDEIVGEAVVQVSLQDISA
jgi:hypothetical protein